MSLINRDVEGLMLRAGQERLLAMPRLQLLALESGAHGGPDGLYGGLADGAANPSPVVT